MSQISCFKYPMQNFLVNQCVLFEFFCGLYLFPFSFYYAIIVLSLLLNIPCLFSADLAFSHFLFCLILFLNCFLHLLIPPQHICLIFNSAFSPPYLLYRHPFELIPLKVSILSLALGIFFMLPSSKFFHSIISCNFHIFNAFLFLGLILLLCLKSTTENEFHIFHYFLLCNQLQPHFFHPKYIILLNSAFFLKTSYF